MEASLYSERPYSIANKTKISQVQWCTPLIVAQEAETEDLCEFEANLVYTMSSLTAGATCWDLVSKNKTEIIHLAPTFMCRITCVVWQLHIVATCGFHRHCSSEHPTSSCHVFPVNGIAGSVTSQDRHFGLMLSLIFHIQLFTGVSCLYPEIS